MTEPAGENRNRFGPALAGFLVPIVLLSVVVLGFRQRLFWDLGWRGGEYAQVFLGVVLAAVLAGIVLKAARPRPPWRSFGTGLILAGTLGTVSAVVVIVAILNALSRMY
ncbi:hypothetical protein [Prauserella endophytica]|uniref:DUF4190 domain-containing protein n=1 Tax=Prauserella endophytica TaxID=1592324 RepID=A0ABY2SB58_9PSEU|nr:hypothetical protein [Prauserella endophytica]TKG72857.1 hypothetical protein FCN18_06465 [Prauserella endophytica]